VSVNPESGIFLTYQPSRTFPSEVPVDVRAMFRQVALLPPDLALVLKAKCAALQFKSPTMLALRLKLVAELAKDQL
jgi:dynein heavy chain